MTKIVIPPPQQPFVADENVNEPWRRHMDATNHAVNAASQLISVVQVTASSTGYLILFPQGWRRYRASIFSKVATTTAQPYIALSADSGVTFANARTVHHAVSDTTVVSIVGTTGAASEIYLTLPNLSTSTTAAHIADVDIVHPSSPRYLTLIRGSYIVDLTTPTMFFFSGGSNSPATVGSINSCRFGTTAGSFTTGEITLYGER